MENLCLRTTYRPILKDIGLFMEDHLNIHNRKLTLLRKTGHMDILYAKEHYFITDEKRDR